MEQVRKFESENGVVYEVNAEYWSTRYSWGHKAEFCIDGKVVSTDSCRYYNRTWESYTYQSVCRCAVYSYLERLTDKLKREFLGSLGLKRMSPKRKGDFEDYLKGSEDYRNVKKFYEML